MARLKKMHNWIIYPPTFASYFNQISRVSGITNIGFCKNNLVTGSVALLVFYSMSKFKKKNCNFLVFEISCNYL